MICGYILFLNIGIRWISFDFLIGKGEVMISFKWLFFALLIGLLLVYLFQNKTIPKKAKWMTIAGFAYISLSWGLMMDLYHHVTDIHLHDTFIVLAAGIVPIIIIASIWINDTMAYIVGSFIGKTPLSKVSPKKTWEGTIGGVILSMLVTGFLIPFIYFNSFNLSVFFFALCIAVISSIAGTFGDLLESKLKRMAGVKDSGSLMPGHGGFLDRFDSLLLATPFVWLFIKLLMDKLLSTPVPTFQ